ncbi:hypothetical protein SAMN05444679_123100 [Variovorax sp. CF079]|uniref:hypothetical protein n=1 Tax=Variovorax sp. CF079 TaxID=1882774 RepID=UPI0008915FCD|nr:hypothetical protein [Variovorax sp. CF079]SDE48663.1 hypothetical protein SAMN05444679_123100 [Variovorax sp. CF079]
MDHFNIGRSRSVTVPAHRIPIALRLLEISLFVGWQMVRLACCALLVLMEPFLRATFVPIAFLGFLVTLVFGFLIGNPRFPRWGMLAFSVGALMLYWLFLGLMSLFMTLPPSHDRH